MKWTALLVIILIGASIAVSTAQNECESCQQVHPYLRAKLHLLHDYMPKRRSWSTGMNADTGAIPPTLVVKSVQIGGAVRAKCKAVLGYGCLHLKIRCPLADFRERPSYVD